MEDNALPILEKLVQELHPRFLGPEQQQEFFIAAVLSRVRDEVVLVKHELIARTFNGQQQIDWYVRVHQQVIRSLQRTLQAYTGKAACLPEQQAFIDLYNSIHEYLDSLLLYISAYDGGPRLSQPEPAPPPPPRHSLLSRISTACLLPIRRFLTS